MAEWHRRRSRQSCRPADAIGHTCTVVLLTVLRLTSAGPPPSVREIALMASVSVSTAHHHLRTLRELGLVDWSDRGHGTVQATVHAVALPSPGGAV
ncbi:helix-turn-helix domain-containing protein [Amycolatopsis palatopharyngis]|uniref:helix-turn-helix domain-containing protein n=1 Tax=Amycolatopsis palatopharyngis TaxID=187982 RepID=UPI000E287162|nr:helix-turn-helix domain-containing protein [Amycolatopsis palatopharyngis]